MAETSAVWHRQEWRFAKIVADGPYDLEQWVCYTCGAIRELYLGIGPPKTFWHGRRAR